MEWWNTFHGWQIFLCPSSFIWTGCARKEFLVTWKVTRGDHKESGSEQITLNQVPGHELPTFSADWGLITWQWCRRTKIRTYLSITGQRPWQAYAIPGKSGPANSQGNIKPHYKKQQHSRRVSIPLLLHLPAGWIESGIDVQKSG